MSNKKDELDLPHILQKTIIENKKTYYVDETETLNSEETLRFLMGAVTSLTDDNPIIRVLSVVALAQAANRLAQLEVAFDIQPIRLEEN